MDICTRFPTLPSCKIFAGNETENVTIFVNQTTTADYNITLNVTVTTAIPQSQIDDYCTKYLKHFEYFCTNTTIVRDQVLTNYCYSYAANCIRFNINLNATEASNVTQLLATTIANTATSVSPLPEQVNGSSATYCKDNQRDYSNLCLHKLIPGFAIQFCTGYHEFCPESPKPGSGSSLVPLVRAKRQQQSLNLLPSLPSETLPNRQKSLNLQEVLYDPYFNALGSSKRTLDQIVAVGANNLPATLNRGIVQ